MTEKDVKIEYSKLFYILMEDAGDQANNDGYKRAKEVTDDISSTFIIRSGLRYNILEDDAISFEEFIMVLILKLITLVLSKEIVAGFSSEEIKERVEDVYTRYLIGGTRKFTSKYGLPTVHSVTSNVDTIQLVGI